MVDNTYKKQKIIKKFENYGIQPNQQMEEDEMNACLSRMVSI